MKAFFKLRQNGGLLVATIGSLLFLSHSLQAQEGSVQVPYGAHYVALDQVAPASGIIPFIRFHESEDEVEFIAPGSELVERAGFALRGDKLLVIGRKAYFDVQGDELVMFYEGTDHRFRKATTDR
jgi:hypothetical protein